MKNVLLVGISLILATCTGLAPVTAPPPAVNRDLIIAAPAVASKPAIGQDTLAVELKSFNSKQLSQANPQGGVFTVLDNTFGTSSAPISLVLAVNKPKYFEFKLINGSCHSDGNCGAYEYAPHLNMAGICALAGNNDAGFKGYIQSRTKVYKKLSTQFPTTTFIASPINEHGCNIVQYRVLANWIRAVWPNVQLANSPLGGINVESYLGAWIERHGNQNIKGAQIVSLDGVDATQIDMQGFLKDTARAKVVEIWGSSYNCRLDNWIDPRSRTACPSQKTFELFAHIADPLPLPVKFTGSQCKKIVPFVAPSIWKPLADYAPNDTRSNLPVMITKVLSPNTAVQVLAANGTRVGTIGYYDTYLDQGWRWYSCYKDGTCESGYQLQHQAQITAGSPYVWLFDGKNCAGPIPPGQRWGKFD